MDEGECHQEKLRRVERGDCSMVVRLQASNGEPANRTEIWRLIDCDVWSFGKGVRRIRAMKSGRNAMEIVDSSEERRVGKEF